MAINCGPVDLSGTYGGTPALGCSSLIQIDDAQVTVTMQVVSYVSNDGAQFRLYVGPTANSTATYVDGVNVYRRADGVITRTYDLHSYIGQYVTIWHQSPFPGASVTSRYSIVGAGFCAYGTQLQSGSTFLYYVTPGFIDLALGAMGLPWLAPIFTGFWFSTINAQQLCSTGPPPMPTITLDTLVSAGPGELWQLFQSVIWHSLCQCAPGGGASPAPIEYPTPTPTQPTGWPAPLTFSCDDGDVCTLLNQLAQSMAAVQKTIRNDYDATTLIQRQAVPFAYLRGTMHGPLSGNGQFAVQGILGLSVSHSAIPAGVGSDTDAIAPSDYFLGWLNLGTADGWLHRIRLTHTTELVLGINGAITKVEYDLPLGSTATITELKREA